MPDEPKRIHSLDFLRGVASLAVCWFHLTRYQFQTPDGAAYEAVRAAGAHGWLGVEVFFVISGFVIPHSLGRAGYRLRDYPRFLLKRVVRLDPPYLAALALILALAFADAARLGRPPVVEGEAVGWARALLHLGYLNMFFGHEWLNPAFWTLAIELQFYALVGLAFPLLGSRRRWARLAALALFGALGCLGEVGLRRSSGAPTSSFIFHFVFLFVMGAATFQRRAGLAGRFEYAATMAGAAAGALLTVGPLPALAGLATAAAISLYRWRLAVTDFFGNISYSLYLLHWPVGHVALSVLSAKVVGASTDAHKLLVLALSLGASFAAAYLLFLLVERPAQRWSSRIRYGRAGRDPRPAETSGLAPAET